MLSKVYARKKLILMLIIAIWLIASLLSFYFNLAYINVRITNRTSQDIVVWLISMDI